MLQRAVVMVLEAIYETDFKDCSYGFRPGRCTPGTGQPLAADDGDGGRLDRGGRYPKILRYDRPRPSCESCSSVGCETGCCFD